jgi:phosphatidylserine/phosphatidylglycerophosphate/cardiolipin synthase-like enzyme
VDSNFLERADAAVGSGIDGLVKSHHRRRLRRIGWLHALDGNGSLWAGGEPPPRPGNDVEVLVDGAAFLPRLAAELERARSHVHIAGWFLSTELTIVREERRVVLFDLLAELAKRVDVRVLLWAGAPLPLFRPSRGEVRELAARLRRVGVDVGLDSKERPMHCHHEKMTVVDDQVATVGGIDLTTFCGDRFDSNAHPYRAALGWHDMSTLLRGPVVEDVANHFRLRWSEVMGEELEPASTPGAVGSHEAQLVQTIPEHVYSQRPRGQFRILEAYTRALASAERLIYIESQFLWSPELCDLLADKLRNPPADEFRLVAVLPSHPQSGNDESRGQVGALAEADNAAGRFLACALYARRGARFDPIYVHAKIGIVDDRWLTVGSANLNEHSLFNDTELNVLVQDEELARSTRERLWAEHLELPLDEVQGADPVRLVDEWWRPIAEEQLERRLRGGPLTHRLSKLPGVSRHSNRLIGPLQGLVVDG